MDKIQEAHDNSALYQLCGEAVAVTNPWTNSLLVNTVRQIPNQTYSETTLIRSLTESVICNIPSVGYLKRAVLVFTFTARKKDPGLIQAYYTSIEDMLGLVGSITFRANGNRMLLTIPSEAIIAELYLHRNRYSRYLELFQYPYIDMSVEGDRGADGRLSSTEIAIPIPFGFLEKLYASFDFTDIKDGQFFIQMTPAFSVGALQSKVSNGANPPTINWVTEDILKVIAEKTPDGYNDNDMLNLQVKMEFDSMIPNPSELRSLKLANREAGPNGIPHLISDYTNGGVYVFRRGEFNTKDLPWPDGSGTQQIEALLPIRIKDAVRMMTMFVCLDTYSVNKDAGSFSKWGPFPPTVGATFGNVFVKPFENMFGTCQIEGSGAILYESSKALQDSLTHTEKSGYTRITNNAFSWEFFENATNALEYGQILPTTNIANLFLRVRPNPNYDFRPLKDNMMIVLVFQTQALMSYSDDNHTFNITRMT